MDIDALASFITLDKHAQRELSKLIPLFKLSNIHLDISVYDEDLSKLGMKYSNIANSQICDFTLYTNHDDRLESDNEALLTLKKDFDKYGVIPNESWFDDSISDIHFIKEQYQKRIQAWKFLKSNINEKNYIWKEAKKIGLNINLNLNM